MVADPIYPPFTPASKVKNKNKMTIKEIESFPFNEFSEFKRACLSGEAVVFVDRDVALSWAAERGNHTPNKLYWKTFLLSYLDWAALIGFVIYIITNQSWMLLFGLPLLLLGFVAFHPASKKALRIIVLPLKTFTIGGFLLSILSSINWLFVLTAALLLVWISQEYIYKSAVDGMIAAAVNDEGFLCGLWNRHVMSIEMDGTRFSLTRPHSAKKLMQSN